jgi:hypothetical protein
VLLLLLLVRVVPELEGVDMANMINVRKRKGDLKVIRSFKAGFI